MSQTRTHKTSDSDDDFDVITLCIDQNQFRSNDLVSLIADERFGFLVPEAAIIEMIKSLEGDIDIPGFDPVTLDFGPAMVPGIPHEPAPQAKEEPSPATASLTCPHCQHQFART